MTGMARLGSAVLRDCGEVRWVPVSVEFGLDPPRSRGVVMLMFVAFKHSAVLVIRLGQ
jgi:hypothetical protein